MDEYDGYSDADVWVPADGRAKVTDVARRSPGPVSARGWTASAVSLVSTVLTLAAITPFARGVLPALPLWGPAAFYGFALVWFWPFIPLGIALNIFAGFGGGRNRRVAVAGGLVMALAGIYAISVLVLVDASLRSAAGV